MQKQRNATFLILRTAAVGAALFVGAALIGWASEGQAGGESSSVRFVEPGTLLEQHPGLPDLQAAAQPGDGLCDPCHY